ncbi:hypothetical protein WJX82_003786 [Trebouxia sp. C0006]
MWSVIDFLQGCSMAGFVIWHPKNRWPLLCFQGISAAHAKLRQLLDNHQADSTKRTPDCKGRLKWRWVHVTLSASSGAQDLTACKEDIVSLIQAIFSHFWSYDLTSVNTPGYGSFEDIALAFGLPYEGFLNNKFKGLALNRDTAGELIHASKAVGWSRLCPVLISLADATCALFCTDSAAGLRVGREAFQGLKLLLGVNDSPMQSAIAAIAVQQAGLLQQLISDDPLGAASMWEHTCSTKPWDASTIDATHDSECDGAAMGTVWPHVDKKLCHYGMRADTRKLVVVAFELFQSLTAKAKQAGTSLQESPAAIKLLAGCVQQLRQAAQPQPQPLDMQQAPKCICNVCQLLQSFLAHPEQLQSLPLGTQEEAEHGIRHLRPHADSQGHVHAYSLEEGHNWDAMPSHHCHHRRTKVSDYTCTKESDADKLRRVQEATLMLATLQRVFSQSGEAD